MARSSSTNTATTTKQILAIGLGKFKSVACDYNPATGEHAFTTLPTRPGDFHDQLTDREPGRLSEKAERESGTGSFLPPQTRAHLVASKTNLSRFPFPPRTRNACVKSSSESESAISA